MYKFHITGFGAIAKDSLNHNGEPVDITVYACKMEDAIIKAEFALGTWISISGRVVVVEEIPEWE